ncbi:MAG: hypothetical protein EPN47_19445 [Acidobacteria bacterium]|nr:MAG: hypothetical protein EPN47_19445 [Acidobacteriota bacterium]
MSYPKIVYTPTGGAEQTLNFTSAPRQQPGYSKGAVRHDNISTAGIRESVLERVDAFLEINVDYIQAGNDLAGWSAFLDFALTGAPFAYFPDASQPAVINCLLEDTGETVGYMSPGIYSVKVKFRQQVL